MARFNLLISIIILCVVSVASVGDGFGQGYPPSFAPSVDRACYQVRLAGDLQRFERPVLRHKRQLPYLEPFRVDRFLDSLGLSQQIRDELRSEIASYDAALQKVTSALMQRREQDLADAGRKFEAVVENLEQVFSQRLTEKQKSIAHQVLLRRTVAAEGMLQVLKTGSSFEVFDCSTIITPVENRILKDYAESILKQ